MKKSELIKALTEIPGDPDVTFAVDNEICCGSHHPFWYCDNINDIAIKTLYEYNDCIFDNYFEVRQEIEDDIDLAIDNEEDFQTAIDAEVEKFDVGEKLQIKLIL